MPGGALAELFVRIGADTRGLKSGLAEGDAALSKTEQQWQRTGAGMRQAGGTLTRNVTLPLLAAGVAATKLAMDFDTTMSRIQGLAGATGAEVAGMRDRVLQLAGETTVAPQQLAEAMYFIASSGIKGAAAMDALEMSAKASAAGLGDVSVVADAVTSAMNAYGPEVLTAAHATDVLVGIVREGKGEADEMAGQLGRILPFASQLGVSFEDLGAGLAYLTRSSGDSRLATTQLGGALQHMLVPSSQGREALDSVGLSADGLRQMIQQKGLLGALVELDDKFGGSEQKWKALVEEGQAVAGILSLVKNHGEDAAPVFDNLADSAGNTENAFSAFAESAGFGAKQSFAELQVALVEMGDQIIPFVAALAKGGAAVATFFGGLPSSVQIGVLAFAGFAASIGPVLTIGGNLIKVWGMMPAAITGAVESLVAATQAAYAANPVLFAVSVAAMAAVAAFTLFGSSSDPAPVRELTQAIQEQGSALGELSRQWLANEMMSTEFGRELLRGLNEQNIGLDELEQALATGGDALDAFNEKAGGGGATSDWLDSLSGKYRASADMADLATDAGADLTGGLTEMGDAAQTAEQQMSDMKSAIEELFAAALGSEGARIQFQLGLMDIQKSISEGTFSLDENTQAGLQNRQSLIGMANDAKTHAAAVYEETGSIDQANFTLGAHINQLAGVMQATGMSEEAAAQYIATLLGIPPDETTTIHSNADLVRYAMGLLHSSVSALDGMTAHISVVADTAGAAAAIHDLRTSAQIQAHVSRNDAAESARVGAGAGAERFASHTVGMTSMSAGHGTAGLHATPGAGLATTTVVHNFYRVTMGEAIAMAPGAVRAKARAFLEGRS